jgi:hypothetical protein
MAEARRSQQMLLDTIAAFQTILQDMQQALQLEADAGLSQATHHGIAEILARLRDSLPDMYMAAGMVGASANESPDTRELRTLQQDVQAQLSSSRDLVNRALARPEFDDAELASHADRVIGTHDEIVHHLSILGPWPPHR